MAEETLKFQYNGVFFIHDENGGVWAGGQFFDLKSRKSVEDFAELACFYAFINGQRDVQSSMRDVLGMTDFRDEVRLKHW